MKVFKLDEIGVMSGDILILKELPETKIILSDKVIQTVASDQKGFIIGKVGAGVNNRDWVKLEEEQDYPNLVEGLEVFVDEVQGLKAFKVEGGDGKLFIALLIQSHNIKFYLK